MFKICGVEVDNIVCSPRWNVFENFFGQIAVRIDETDTFASHDVLDDEVSKKRRLACTCFPDRVEVLPPIDALKTKRNSRGAPKISRAQKDVNVYVFRHTIFFMACSV